MKQKILNFASSTLIVLVILSLTNVFSACSDNDKNEADSLTETEKSQLLERAYVFTLPLMLMDATFVKMTNTVEPRPQQSPANRFIHARSLANASSKDVVTPNSDTNYSQIMMDLSENALVVKLPKTYRFCLAQTMDAWSNCIAAPDATTINGEYGYFLFTGPNFKGKIPGGMTVIKSPTNHVWMLLRTLCYGEDDLVNVHEIQDKMATYLLDDFVNDKDKEYEGTGTYDPANNFIPVDHVMQMGIEEYFTQANELMVTNPPAAEDAEWMADLRKIGVGPGMKFDASIFGDKADDMWKTLVANIIPITKKYSEKFTKTNGNWNYYGAPIGEFGTEYYYRAMIAVVALAANPVRIAVYPRTDLDSENGELNGNNRYCLHIDKENWPQIRDKGFWSITLYGEDNFFYDNEIDRYNITDRTDVETNDDGSLDIYIQNEKYEAQEKNWLPAPKGKFHLYFRIYNPVDRIIQNEWVMPEIKKIG